MKLDPFDLCRAKVGDDPGAPPKAHRPVVVVSSRAGISTGFVAMATGFSQVGRYRRKKFEPRVVLSPSDYPELLERETISLPFRLGTVQIAMFDTSSTGVIVRAPLLPKHRMALQQALAHLLAMPDK